MTSESEKTTDRPHCPVCPAGRLQEGTTTLTMERGGSTIVFKGVPADVCDTCGESFIDEDVSAEASQQAEAAVEAGVEVDVRRWRKPQPAQPTSA